MYIMQMNTTTKPRFDTKILDELEKEPPYSVILWNDEVHSQIEVVVILVKVMRWSVRHATSKMFEVDTLGKSILIVTHKERAEMFAEQLTPLTATIERQ